MNTRVWVGPAENAPTGWTVVGSLEAFLSTSPHLNPTQIVFDDRAAALRESDFQRVYAHSPLARITRIVGPWRAGIGRTDPAWPLATTLCDGPSNLSDLAGERDWLPLTSGYDECAAAHELANLSGLIICVNIRDPELREMWIDTLQLAGAELKTDGAEVLIQDGSEPLIWPESPRPTEPSIQVIVSLRDDPWNLQHDQHPEWTLRSEQAAERAQANSGSVHQIIRIVASILDPPAAVMQRAVEILKRGPT